MLTENEFTEKAISVIRGGREQSLLEEDVETFACLENKIQLLNRQLKLINQDQAKIDVKIDEL